jgi:glycosyltransferase involved in cell wall biosynthesis
VIVMDGDLQHPPSLLLEMIDAWRQGKGHIVEGIKTNRGDEPLLYGVFAAGFYGLLKRLSGFDLRGASDYKLLDRKVVDAWLRLRERNLFFRGMTAWLGFPRHQIPFEVAPRVGGRTRWSFLALVRLALTAVTSFSSVLLQLVTFFGILFLAFALILGAYTLSYWAAGRAVTGFTTVIVILLIIGSALMISLGVIGLYLARIYDEVKARPRYLVCENIGFTEGAPAAQGESPASAGEAKVEGV